MLYVVENREPHADSYKHPIYKIGINYISHPDRTFRLRHGVEDAFGIANFLCGTTIPYVKYLLLFYL